MTTAILYCRCSTTSQAEEGVSLEAQATALKTWASLQGFSRVELVMETGVSGSVPLAKRPGGDQLEGILRKTKNAVVVATKLDRLWRKTSDALASVEAWERKGVSLVLLDMGGSVLDTRTPMGKLMLTMLSSFAECERSLIAERTRSALSHKRNQGQRVSHVAPLGFSFHEGTLVKNDHEQLVLSRVHELRCLGFSWNQIAGALNKNPSYKDKARGKRWYGETLRRSVAA